MTEPAGEPLLYSDDNGAVRLHVRLVDGTVGLSNGLMAQLFGKDVRPVGEHLRNILDEGELVREASVRRFRMVQTKRSWGISQGATRLEGLRRPRAAARKSDDDEEDGA
jgi:hypothetical protein